MGPPVKGTFKYNAFQAVNEVVPTEDHLSKPPRTVSVLNPETGRIESMTFKCKKDVTRAKRGANIYVWKAMEAYERDVDVAAADPLSATAPDGRCHGRHLPRAGNARQWATSAAADGICAAARFGNCRA